MYLYQCETRAIGRYFAVHPKPVPERNQEMYTELECGREREQKQIIVFNGEKAERHFTVRFVYNW